MEMNYLDFVKNGGNIILKGYDKDIIIDSCRNYIILFYGDDIRENVKFEDELFFRHIIKFIKNWLIEDDYIIFENYKFNSENKNVILDFENINV